MSRSTQIYFGGLLVVLIASALTIALKLAVSSHLGLGDLFLAVILTSVFPDLGDYLFFAAKAFVGGSVFSIFYLALRHFQWGFSISLIVAILFLSSMSLGGGPLEF